VSSYFNGISAKAPLKFNKLPHIFGSKSKPGNNPWNASWWM